MVRTPCCDNSGLKKGTWTPEEDRKLMAYVSRYGCWNWRQLPKYAGLSRCGKSCRLRWMNYLRPNIKRGNYTKEEEDTIVRLHNSLGNRWSAIAAQLPGRTDNEIKNHWHTNLKKRGRQNSVTNETNKPNLHEHETKTQTETMPNQTSEEEESKPNIVPLNNETLQVLKSSPSSSEISSITTDSTAVLDDSVALMEEYGAPTGNFWTEPFLADNSYMPSDFLASLVDPGFLFPDSPEFDGEIFCPSGFRDELESFLSRDK